jgi:hypothetical protein
MNQVKRITSKLLKNNLFVLLLVIVVTFLALGKTTGFYYWWDDFSIFYNARNFICPFPWPFSTVCLLWDKLYPILGYDNPSYWFTFAVILRALVGYLVFIFGNRLYNRKIAFFLSLLTVSWGGEGDMLINGTISTNLSLIFLLLSLLCLSNVKKKGIKSLFLGIILFFLSVMIIPLYATGHVFMILAFLLIFLKSILTKKILITATVLVFIMTIYAFIGEPYRLRGDALSTWKLAIGTNKLNVEYFTNKAEYYVSTTSSFILNDYLEEKLLASTNIKRESMRAIRIIIGSVINFSFIVFLIKNRKDSNLFKIGTFAYLWLITQYLPRAFQTGFALSSTNRHIYYPYIGFIMMLGVIALKKTKYIFPILALLIVSNLINTNYYFSKYVDINKRKSVFYKELRSYLKDKVPKGASVYFDTPRGKIAEDIGIFVRAGMHKHEASIATELNIKIEDIKMYADSTVFGQKIIQGDIDPDKFFSFYWDGKHLFDNTLGARDILKGKIVPNQIVNSLHKTNFVYDKNSNLWTGSNNGIAINLKGFQPIIPSKIYLSIKTDVADFPLTYTQGCTGNCSFQAGENKRLLEYLTKSRVLKSNVSIGVSSTWEDTTAENMIDDSLGTYWVSDRYLWYQGDRPVITLTFPTPRQLDGIILNVPFGAAKTPTEFKITADGKNVDSLVVENHGGKIKLVGEFNMVKVVKITILKTTGDMPLVSEIGIIPQGFSYINLDLAEKASNYPAAMIKTFEEKHALLAYLTSGVKACIKWKDPEYGESKSDFTLYADGQWHLYEVPFPVWGMANPEIKLDCLNYPVNVNLSSVRIDYLYR